MELSPVSISAQSYKSAWRLTTVVWIVLIALMVPNGRSLEKLTEYALPIKQNYELIICSSIALAYVLVRRLHPQAFLSFIALNFLFYISVGPLAEWAHLIQYSVLSFCFAQVFQPECFKTAIKLILAASAIGFVDEALQALHPERFFDVKDLYLNLLGASIGMSLYYRKS